DILDAAGAGLRLPRRPLLAQHLAHAGTEEAAEEHAARDAGGSATQRGAEEPSGRRAAEAAGRGAGAHLHATGLAPGHSDDEQDGADCHHSVREHVRTSCATNDAYRRPYHRETPPATEPRRPRI